MERNSDYFGIEVPFMRHIGLEPVSMGPDICSTRLPLNTETVNSRGVVHGGALMSVLDFTLSAAARSHAPLNYSVVTIDLATHFLNEAKSELWIEGRCIRRGRSIVFCEGDVRDRDGQLVTIARGVFKLLDIDRGHRGR
ncbi:PaaI family thioesterase [Xanthobacter aminoxidans]|uniref:PaaI family thioesterase n=1 Tax=Xanthobacter aminoxidans TaxID=186280 RepID=UPI0020230E74|nr:PaaI family thioesterase [Xanthobacter aminoxidans]MCL8385423.1 PaaI family thioesterase [Xanthobacter aminoxidans]